MCNELKKTKSSCHVDANARATSSAEPGEMRDFVSAHWRLLVSVGVCGKLSFVASLCDTFSVPLQQLRGSMCFRYVVLNR